MRLVIDASVYISFLNDEEMQYSESVAFFERFIRGRAKVFNPEICITEVAAAQARKRATLNASTEAFAFLLSQPRTQFFPITRQVTRSAIDVVEEYRLKSSDSLYFAVATLHECDAVVTWDKEMLNLSHIARTPDKLQNL